MPSSAPPIPNVVALFTFPAVTPSPRRSHLRVTVRHPLGVLGKLHTEHEVTRHIKAVERFASYNTVRQTASGESRGYKNASHIVVQLRDYQGPRVSPSVVRIPCATCIVPWTPRKKVWRTKLGTENAAYNYPRSAMTSLSLIPLSPVRGRWQGWTWRTKLYGLGGGGGWGVGGLGGGLYGSLMFP